MALRKAGKGKSKRPEEDMSSDEQQQQDGRSHMSQILNVIEDSIASNLPGGEASLIQSGVLGSVKTRADTPAVPRVWPGHDGREKPFLRRNLAGFRRHGRLSLSCWGCSPRG